MVAIVALYARSEIVRGEQCTKARLADGATRASRACAGPADGDRPGAHAELTGWPRVPPRRVRPSGSPAAFRLPRRHRRCLQGRRRGDRGEVVDSAGEGPPHPATVSIEAGEFLLGDLDQTGGHRQGRSPRCWAETAPTRRSASSTRTWPASAPSPGERRLAARAPAGGRQDGRRWRSGAPLAPAPELADPSWRPTPSATMTSPTPTTPGA
jgi:hypothetical protein